nr:hypothetical protein [Tanacetum cinerariifolium]
MGQLVNAFNKRPQGALPSNTIPNTLKDIKVITTRSSITLNGPPVRPPNPLFSSKEVERDSEPTMDQVHILSLESTTRVPSLVIQPSLTSKLNEIPERNPHQPPIPYPSRLNKDKLQDKSDIQIHKFLEKLLELANTSLNENCSVVLLKKIPKNLRDLGKFLIPCDCSDLEECMDLADLGRPFLNTVRALVDVQREEFTLRVGDEKLVFNVESTLKYPHKHGDGDYLLEETDAHLALDDLIPLEINEGIFDPDGDILLLVKLLNDEILKDFTPKELKDDEIKTTESSIKEPPD